MLNDVLCDVEYQMDGSSNTDVPAIFEKLKGFAFLRKVAMTYPISKKRLIRDCITIALVVWLQEIKIILVNQWRKVLTVLCTPLGCGY